MNAQAQQQHFTPPPLYRLADAIRRFFPAGSGITVSSLRNEARRGRLHIIKIANKDFVTAEAIQAMLERCTCHVPESPPASISENTSAASRNGQSLTEQGRSARTAAQLILQAHRKR